MKRFLIILILLIIAAAAGIWFKDALIALMPAPPAPAPAQQAEPTPPPAPPAPEPAPEPQQAEPTPPPAPEPPPAPPVVRKPMERPHSAEHAAVLQAARAAEPDAPGQELDALVQEKRISPEAAENLRHWTAEHPEYTVEEIGTAAAATPGEKETRYRLISKQGGGEDALVSVITPKQGKPYVSKAEKTANDKTKVTPESDALTVVEGFVEALKRGDMATARRMVAGGEVSDATLAGLCMMFEEGDFAMRKKLPIRNMFQTQDNAGFLIYMTSADSKAGNVGIEATYTAERGWAVKAVALDNLLNRYEASAEAEGGMYFPIVKNPQGGDSLVLYFGFNDASLSPRSLSQLKIVANLLKDTKGILSISGHTDDVGTAAYNQTLSERRATAVKEALISLGVGPAQISTKGMGKSQPLRTYHVGDTMQTIRHIRGGNRRAEIYLDF